MNAINIGISYGDKATYVYVTRGDEVIFNTVATANAKYEMF